MSTPQLVKNQRDVFVVNAFFAPSLLHSIYLPQSFI